VRTARDHAQALNIRELAERVHAQQDTKHDYVADTRRVGFHEVPVIGSDGASASDFELTIDGINDQVGAPSAFGINEIAHEQIGTRLGIPKKYYERMRGEAPALLKRNVDHWFVNDPEKRMFRTLDGNVRAVLSDRYRPLDNVDLIEYVLPELFKVEGLEFFVTSLTPERMFIRATLPRLTGEIRVGDTVQAGVEISNSEVGRGSLTVSPWILRLDCLNGMTSKVAIRKYHAGRRIEETDDVLGIFRDETIAQDDKAFFMKAADMARAALSDITFGRIVEQLRATATGEQIAEPVAAVQVLSKRLDLTEGEGQSVLNFLRADGDLSQWGAINALTETAKQATTFNRLAELEEKAGELAEFTKQDWTRVAVAAA